MVVTLGASCIFSISICAPKKKIGITFFVAPLLDFTVGKHALLSQTYQQIPAKLYTVVDVITAHADD